MAKMYNICKQWNFKIKLCLLSKFIRCLCNCQKKASRKSRGLGVALVAVPTKKT